MEKYIIYIYLLFIFILLLLIQLSSSIIIFPVGTIKEDKDGNTNPDDNSYNYKNFINDYFTQLTYINMSIGNSPKEIKIILTYQESGFKIKNESECINYKGKEEININAFSDIKLKNELNCDNINFDLITSIFGQYINYKNYKEEICGIIGFRKDRYDPKIYNIKNNIITNFYSKGYIKETEWMLKYTSKESGLLIFGSDNLNDLIPNFNIENLIKTNAIVKESNYNWAFDIQKIICINTTKDNYNDTYIIHKESTKAEINNDISLIQGSYNYYSFIEKNYFEKYIQKKICTKYIYTKNEYNQFFIFECDKKDFNEKYLKDFPKLCFYSFLGNAKFEFDYKDLFTETKYKYFFNVIFSVYNVDYWIFGRLFLRKYLIIINPEDKIIKLYLDNNKNNKTNVENKKEGEKNSKLSFKQIIFIMLFISFGFLCFYFGRKFRRERRKKANELIDEYDYNSNNIKNEDKVINYNNY